MIFLLTSFGVVCFYFNFYAFDDAHQNKQEIIQEISSVSRCMERKNKANAKQSCVGSFNYRYGYFRNCLTFYRVWSRIYSLNYFARYVKFTKRVFFVIEKMMPQGINLLTKLS